MGDQKSFCNLYFNRYYECLRINLDVFGKERGLVMCENIKNILNNAGCLNSDDQLNINMEEYIDKMIDSIKKK